MLTVFSLAQDPEHATWLFYCCISRRINCCFLLLPKNFPLAVRKTKKSPLTFRNRRSATGPSISCWLLRKNHDDRRTFRCVYIRYIDLSIFRHVLHTSRFESFLLCARSFLHFWVCHDQMYSCPSLVCLTRAVVARVPSRRWHLLFVSHLIFRS